jgi:hypothetical protein
MRRSFLTFATIATLGVAVPLVGSSKKSSGQILDEQGFRNVQTVCAEVEDIGPRYATMVQTFLKSQDNPKSLVSRLPWKIVPDCSQADAVMRFKFSETSEPSNATAGGSIYAGGSMGTVNTTWFQVTAVVTARSTQKEIYEVQGARAPERGEKAVENTFKVLAKDLRLTQ